MPLKLEEIPRVPTITKEEFIQHYFKPQKPLVVERAVEHWPAISKWSLDYMSKVAGHKVVPLYDDRPVHHEDGFNEPHAEMKMTDYINLLKSEPTRYRIFLWNIFKEVPALQNDFDYPDFGLKLQKKLPMLFFGGRDSYTFMHYDIDLSNIFHFHFEGKKECILFPQSETKYLYKVPHSLITHESIDFSQPDLERWPSLRKANGYKTYLNHGEMLYMPEGYWHYMKYHLPGFSMSLRSWPKKPSNFAKGLYNVVVMRNFDVFMRKLQGQKWIEYKNLRAIQRTE
ncbi:cupin-like domain-containing protein [Flavobacteriaceae bacterium TP-CH-4]|uniref:Cupin-like domain-containing protein n=1 Tax=Pelagihabitans pacificus TaxID=2696054 RepID=A0A967AR48_9FLAO|nr:cupin-like domain-containing protein [Pelagihabitans pacificus]NHF58763.1 cupin-like domain-containing protein [Pelagihabitans pacificus]